MTTEARAQDRFIVCNGLRFHYREWGDPGAPPVVREIRCPTLLVRGAESDVLGRETAEQMARAITRCTFVEVPASGHSVHVDNLQGDLAAVEPFIVATTL